MIEMIGRILSWIRNRNPPGDKDEGVRNIPVSPKNIRTIPTSTRPMPRPMSKILFGVSLKYHPEQFEVIIPHYPPPLPNRASDNDEYNSHWIRKYWEEGLDYVAMSDHLEIHPDEVFRLMKVMELRPNAPKCSVCGYRGHNKRNCPKVLTHRGAL